MIAAKVRKHVATLALMGGLVGLGACSDVQLPAELDQLETYASDINMLEFSSSLDARAIRVDVALYGERMVAREVAIRSGGDAVEDEERIHARVVGVERTDQGALVNLDIAGLAVVITTETRFVVRSSDAELDFESFIARVTAAVTDGQHPAIVALRLPPDAPQAPDDGEFVAAAIVLVGEGEGRIISLNIDHDNLMRNEAPPPDGWLAVLGVEIELRVSEGLTHIKREHDDIVTKRFEGVVGEVSLEDSTVTLGSGTIVRILDGTVFRYEEGDEHRLPSLHAVARALEAGEKVVTAGVGIVRQKDPLVLLAIAVVFELAPPPVIEFEGFVEAVDLTDSTVTLRNGAILHITAETEFRGELERDHVLGSLEEVAKALDEDETVVAHGVGILLQSDLALSASDPAEIEVLKVAFVVRLPPMEGFRGVVESVDPTDSIVRLEGGPTVKITADTEVLFESDEHQLATLEDVVAALAEGKTVYAAGVGEVIATDVASTGPVVIIAHKIVFWLAPPDVTPFHGVVKSVDVTKSLFELADGTVVRVVDHTIIWFTQGDASSLRSLEAVAEALEAGLTVLAAGVGVVEATDPLTITARKVGFMVVPPGIQYFEGVITSVDREAKTFTLDDGTTVRIVEGTLIVHEDGGNTIGSVDALAEVVANDGRVVASGLGLLETSDPLVLIGIVVVLRF
jgi:hypothetical protein